MQKKLVRVLNSAVPHTNHCLATWCALIDTIYEELLVSDFNENEKEEHTKENVERKKKPCVGTGEKEMSLWFCCLLFGPSIQNGSKDHVNVFKINSHSNSHQFTNTHTHTHSNTDIFTIKNKKKTKNTDTLKHSSESKYIIDA